MLRIAMLSGWHVHAKGYAEQLRALPDVDITTVWDEEPDRGTQWAASMGVAFQTNLDTLLSRDDVDGVVVCAPTNRHAEVMVAAAQAKKHIFTEKVMALTVEECNTISDAVREAGVKFCISFPARTQAPHLFAKRVAEENMIGDITVLRVRVAHNGASGEWLPPHFYDPVACGGGAMMDLGAHPMYLARWILGEPVRVSSTFSHITGHAVEDNAVSLIEFENKAIGIIETSFVSAHCPQFLELYGTDGCLLVGGPENQVRIISKKLESSLDGWISPAQLPSALPTPIKMWVSGIRDDTSIPFGLEEGTQLTQLMEAAYLSHREQRQVEIPAL